MKKLKGTLTLMMSLAFAFVLTACGSQTQNNNDATSNAASNKPAEEVSSVATAPAGDSIRVAFDLQGTTGHNFDYVWWNRGNIYQVLTFRGLFKANPALTEFEPDLAESYEMSEDGLEYTFKMKDGLKWSDGEPLTAEDVKFSLNTALKTSLINGIYVTSFSKIEGADEVKDGKADELTGVTVDGNTIKLKLTQPVGNLIGILSQFAILPEHSLKDQDPLKLNTAEFWKKPVTNGVFKVDEVKTDQSIKLSYNENYDGKEPQIKNMDVVMVSDFLTAAKGGQIDYFNTKVPPQIDEMNGQDGWSGYPVDTLFYYYLIMNIEGVDGNVNENHTFEDPKVREAFMYAIDRKSLAESLYPGLANVINSGVPESDEKNYNSENETYEFNPDKAKKLLEEAKFDFSKTYKFRYYMADQTSVDLYNAIAAQLGQIGVQVEVQAFSGDATSEISQIRDYDFVLKGLSAFGYEEWYGEYSTSNATFPNIIGNQGEAFADDYDKLLKESDVEKRSEILKSLQKTEQEQLLKLPLFTLKNVIFVNTKNINVGKDAQFGNPRYAYDLHFEDWTLNK